MKKFLILFICSLFSLLSACTINSSLLDNVSELKLNVFEGQSQSYKIVACYGYQETPFDNDGVVNKKVYKISFRLVDNFTNDITYTLNFIYQEKEYSVTFLINPVKHSLTAQVPIENFDINEFSVYVKAGTETECVEMKSIVPDKTLSAEKALQSVKEKQAALWDSYLDENGVFNAEIHLRIIVKDGKSFWYVGFHQADSLKALLVDGFTGDILAIKDILR